MILGLEKKTSENHTSLSEDQEALRLLYISDTTLAPHPLAGHLGGP